jgi:hypothetical protein
LFKSQLKPKKP